MKIGVKTIVMTCDDLLEVLDAKSIDVGIIPDRNGRGLSGEDEIIKG